VQAGAITMADRLFFPCTLIVLAALFDVSSPNTGKEDCRRKEKRRGEKGDHGSHYVDQDQTSVRANAGLRSAASTERGGQLGLISVLPGDTMGEKKKKREGGGGGGSPMERRLRGSPFITSLLQRCIDYTMNCTFSPLSAGPVKQSHRTDGTISRGYRKTVKAWQRISS